MIIATAGHVDHGKTALVRALTGQQTDRTAEELRRGMSIELGYAFLETPGSHSLDFVDVPGHEKFMRTLLSGVARVDALMLVVAADDGAMPQTSEHLALAGLLDMQRIVVVISKCALVPPEQVRMLEADMIERVQREGCPAPVCFTVDSLAGSGIDPLRAHLQRWANETKQCDTGGPARMIIDRHFSQPGHGSIVTGTLLAGRIGSGDSLQLSDTGAKLRVRGIQIHHQAAQQALAGQRCAINLGGDLSGAAPGRGSQLLAQGTWAPTSRFDARVRLIDTPPRGLVQLHVGSAVINARMLPLGAPTSAQYGPEAETYSQWILDQPMCCFQGDRFVIRDPAARRLLGCGIVVDPFAPRRGRQKSARLAVLQALDQADTARAMEQLLDILPDGLDLQPFMMGRHLDQLPAIKGDTLQIGQWLCRQGDLDALSERAVALVSEHHQLHPDKMGPSRAQLAKELGIAPGSRLLAAAVRDQLDAGALRQSGPCLHLPDHETRPDAQTLALYEQIRPHMLACAPRPPVIGELIEQLQLDKQTLLQGLDRLCSAGLLVFVSRNRYLLPKDADRLLARARELAATQPDGLFSTADFRDHSGIGRNHSVAVLEYFDRAGVTRQLNGKRMLC